MPKRQGNYYHSIQKEAARASVTEVGNFFSIKCQRVNIVGFAGVQSLCQLLNSANVARKQP